MPVPGPPELGRGVVVLSGAAVPGGWAGAPVVVVDEAALADPAVVVGALHDHWAARHPVVIELAVDPATFRSPVDYAIEPWKAGPDAECWSDRLHFLVWANTYDARSGEAIWWWGRKAARLGALDTAEGLADVTLPDGRSAWIDGGPRRPIELESAVVHAESVEAGALTLVPQPVAPQADLAPDQLDAVAHGSGPARIIAPAGSGKTRVLTERLRHLLTDRRYEPGTTLALAYNKQAQLEMAQRTAGLGARIQTLNALGYSLVARYAGGRPDIIEEREVRAIVEHLVPRKQRRANTDPIGPYIDGLSLIRLGLRDPELVEEQIDGVEGLAAAFHPYRDELTRRRVLDFDDQVYRAVELLLSDGAFRRAMQAEHRHLLVDELQDLTPAHVLMVRLLAAPAFDVFGVGDDDQCIYGHAGADPRFLIEYARSFPAAGAHALEVNYRCPVEVIDGARHLLAYNERRVAKEIRPGPAAAAGSTVDVRRHPSEGGATELVAVVQGWLDDEVAPADIAVLARVNSMLLAPHVALASSGVRLSSNLRPEVLDRLGLRAALAYLRIAADPDSTAGGDLVEVYRRPSRGLPAWVDKWLSRCHTIDGVADAADRIDDAKVADKLRQLYADLATVARVAKRGTTRDVLVAVRDDVGLGRAMTLLDASSGGDGSSHLDDLEALLQVADLHPDVATFEPWLRATFHREAEEGGVTLSTVHRVKGREWPRVALFGITDGIVPHRLAIDIEEERRVLHVAMTRAGERLAILADAARPSPFLDELDGSAAHHRSLRAAPPTIAAAPSAAKARQAAAPGLVAAVGLRVRVLGGYEGEIAAVDLDGVRLALDDGRSLFVRYGEQVDDAGGRTAALRSPLVAKAGEALRAWRLARSKADAVPAFVVLSDKHLEGIAERAPTSLDELAACPGIGPSKLESYGDDILEVLEGVL